MKWIIVSMVLACGACSCGDSEGNSHSRVRMTVPWMPEDQDDTHVVQATQTETPEDCTLQMYGDRARCVAAFDAWHESGADYAQANGHAFAAIRDCFWHAEVHYWQCAGK